MSKSSQVPLRFVPLLGIAVGVTIRLKNTDDEPATSLSADLKVNILALVLVFN